ncbi:MAG: hypothetical protein AAF721_19530 [Myxococcota bacterium]
MTSAGSRWTALVAVGLALSVATACGKRSAPEGVTALSIEDPRGYWAKEGFVQLVPPIHLPSSNHQRDEVEIWMRVDKGSTIEELSPGKDGAPVGLRFPPGSVLDRVEYGEIRGKRYVVDVRGTRTDDAGAQHFHVYRRGKRGLFGFEWARQDEAAHARATEALIEGLGGLLPEGEPEPAWFQSVRAKNACADCHGLSRQTNTTQGEFGLVNRGTDASGYFTPWTIMTNEIPLERYGGHDRSETDRYTDIRCPAGSAETTADDGRARCDGGAVPVGKYALQEALAAGEPRALQVCTARKQLAAHFSAGLRERFAQPLQECEDSP